MVRREFLESATGLAAGRLINEVGGNTIAPGSDAWRSEFPALNQRGPRGGSAAGVVAQGVCASRRPRLVKRAPQVMLEAVPVGSAVESRSITSRPRWVEQGADLRGTR